MTTLQKIILGIVIVGLVVVGVVVFTQKTPQPITPQETVGAVPGQTLSGPCIEINGVQTCYYRAAMRTATTTFCAFKSPTNASSTLIHASAKFDTSSSGAVIISMAQATTAFATTTRIGSEFITTANAKHTIVASSSDVEGYGIFKPGNYLVFGMEGTTVPASNAPEGYCEAEFRVN